MYIFQEMNSDFRKKIGIRLNPTKTRTVTFSSPPTHYNVTAAALEAGFDIPMHIPSLKTTRFVKLLNFPSNQDVMHRICPPLGGIVVPEYNSEVSSALTSVGGNTPLRPMSTMKTIDPNKTDVFIIVYQNGMKVILTFRQKLKKILIMYTCMSRKEFFKVAWNLFSINCCCSVKSGLTLDNFDLNFFRTGVMMKAVKLVTATVIGHLVNGLWIHTEMNEHLTLISLPTKSFLTWAQSEHTYIVNM